MGGVVIEVPVVWICGPPGIGKSTVGWQLYARWAGQGRTVGYVDIDQLAMRLPADPDRAGATRTKAANLIALLPNYVDHGAEAVVISGIATPDDATVFEAEVGPVHWVRLTADRDELHRRITGRDGAEAAFFDDHADELDESTFAQLVVQSSGLAPAQVAQLIDDQLPLTTAVAVLEGHDRTRTQQPCRVVVLSGPRAVGVSTTGWELFQLNRLGEPTAYIDLAQVGFLNVGTELGVRHHELRAANLAAMVRTYARQDCRSIIAGGTLLTSTQRAAYADRLSPTPMTVVALMASSEQLRQRTEIRRAWSGGPHLAGDDLRGCSAAAGARVLDEALREADLLREASFADLIIDTTDLAAADVALEIRRSLTS